ncbi:hypothetical protein A1Q2_07518 [Trichosporon asahii var. asahii CBS 8904]|uniref:Uncharacterized protein n=1 Tax=Trichosporon asahii var. asahii (strain CBS 8904) TaxID=1220162 RepID=K1VGL1_TRIAC|nr:hypothetical protein A1Q2_07518 [Trichosporon asahii var. asahii CBS 8904]
MSFFKNKLSRGHSMRVPADERPPRMKLSSLLPFGSSRRAGRPVSPLSPLSTGGVREAASAASATLRGGLQRKGSTYRQTYHHLDADQEPPQEWAPVPLQFVQDDFAYYSRDWNHYESDRRYNAPPPKPRMPNEDSTMTRSSSDRQLTQLGSNNPFNPHGTVRRAGGEARAPRVPPPKPVWVQFEDEWSSASSGSNSS